MARITKPVKTLVMSIEIMGGQVTKEQFLEADIPTHKEYRSTLNGLLMYPDRIKTAVINAEKLELLIVEPRSYTKRFDGKTILTLTPKGRSLGKELL